MSLTLPDVNLKFAVISLSAVFIVSRVLKFVNGLKAVSYRPGIRVLFSPISLAGAVIPSTWWNPNIMFFWTWRSRMYKPFNDDTNSLVPFLAGAPMLYTADVDVFRQFAAPGRGFAKSGTTTGSFTRWGMNMFTAEGETWKKHRRIGAPAFNTKLYQRVWAQGIATYREMLAAEGWTDKRTVDVPVVQPLTYRFALAIFMRCGFGMPFDWSEPPTKPDGSLSIHEAIRIMVASNLIIIYAPWLLKIPLPKFRKIRDAENQTVKHLREQVAQRKAEIGGEVGGGKDSRDNNIFTMFVEANETENQKSRLSDQELIGNIYLTLFAGHESTAQTLAAALAELAVHQDFQQEVYEHIISVVGATEDPKYEDQGKLFKVHAAFLEAMRLFPAVYLVMREAPEDTILTVPKPFPQEGTMSLPVMKGTFVVGDVIGAQYNPRYFDEPEKYKPSRWYGQDSDSETLLAFSIGGRACIGRKFAMTEAVSFLTILLREWKIEPLLSEGETIDVWKERVFKGQILFTLGICDAPLRFVRRRTVS